LKGESGERPRNDRGIHGSSSSGVSRKLPHGKGLSLHQFPVEPPSIKIGPVTTEHVPCVILPGGARNPGPPVLGADLLALIGAEEDSDGPSLVVTRILPRQHNVAPVASPHHAAPEPAHENQP